MSLNFSYTFNSGSPSSQSFYIPVYCPSIDKVIIVSDADEVFVVDLEAGEWSEDLGPFTTESSYLDGSSYAFYRPPSYQGNTYGAIWVVNPTASDADFIRIGEIDSADGETITWSSYGAPGYTAGSGDGFVYDYTNDYLWIIKSTESILTKFDIQGDTWAATGSSNGVVAIIPKMAFDGTYIYLFSGYSVFPHVLLRFDIGAGSWTSLPSTGFEVTTAQSVRYIVYVDGHLVMAQWESLGATWSKGLMVYDLDDGASGWVFEAATLSLFTSYAPGGIPTVRENSLGGFDLVIKKNNAQDLSIAVNPTKRVDTTGVLKSRTKEDREVFMTSGPGTLIPVSMAGKSQTERSAVMRAKTEYEFPANLAGYSHPRVGRTAKLKCGSQNSLTRGTVLRGSHTLDAEALLNCRPQISRQAALKTHPGFFTQKVLETELLEIVSYEKFEVDSNEPMFFNELTLKYNPTPGGKEFSSSLIMRSVLSQAYYREVVPHTVELPMVYDQVTAQKLGHQMLLQHHILPLLIQASYRGEILDLGTMDFVEFAHPFGVSESGRFDLIVARIKEIRIDENFADSNTLFLLTSDYLYLPPSVETAQISDSGLVVSTSSRRTTGLRTFTILESSEGTPPIAGAEVTVVQTGEVGTTDKFGNVSFTLSPGTYLLRVVSAGHSERTFTEVVS